MPKYWGKQIFTHRRFPEVGQKQMTEKEKEKEKKEKKKREREKRKKKKSVALQTQLVFFAFDPLRGISCV